MLNAIGGTIARISMIAGDEAAKGTSHVASSISEVSDGAIKTGSASSQVLTSARTLSKESASLKNAVEEFLATVRAAGASNALL